MYRNAPFPVTDSYLTRCDARKFYNMFHFLLIITIYRHMTYARHLLYQHDHYQLGFLPSAERAVSLPGVGYGMMAEYG